LENVEAISKGDSFSFRFPLRELCMSRISIDGDEDVGQSDLTRPKLAQHFESMIDVRVARARASSRSQRRM